MAEAAEEIQEDVSEEVVDQSTETTVETSSDAPVDWRADLPDDLKEVADRHDSIASVIRSNQDLRKQTSHTRVPGKDASEDDIAAYHKAIGVPEKAEDYGLIPEGDISDEEKASFDQWATHFHELKVPKDTALQLTKIVAEQAANQLKAQVEADKAFVKAEEDALRGEWKGDDFDKNMTIANRAFAEISKRAGVDVEDLKKIETKDGRFLMDRAEMSRLFAVIGREMGEGTLGPSMNESEIETMEEQIADLRKQQTEAQNEGDTKKANKLYQKEQALIAKLKGDQPVVGAQGRVA